MNNSSMISFGFILLIVGIILCIIISLVGIILLVIGLVLLLMGIMEKDKHQNARRGLPMQPNPRYQWQQQQVYYNQGRQPQYQGGYSTQASGSQMKICKRCGHSNDKWKLSCDRCKSSLG